MSTSTRQSPRPVGAPGVGDVRSTLLRTVGGMAAVACLAVVLALFIGDGRPRAAFPGLPDPGLLTGWGLPLSATLANLAGAFTVGLLLAAAMFLPSRKGALGSVALRCMVGASIAAGAWVVFVLFEATLHAVGSLRRTRSAGARPDRHHELPDADRAGPGTAGAADRRAAADAGVLDADDLVGRGDRTGRGRRHRAAARRSRATPAPRSVTRSRCRA